MQSIKHTQMETELSDETQSGLAMLLHTLHPKQSRENAHLSRIRLKNPAPSKTGPVP